MVWCGQRSDDKGWLCEGIDGGAIIIDGGVV